MAFQIRCLLILTGLAGVGSILTVKRVTARSRDSITIPCLYDAKYKHHVKYLCKGFHWTSCSYSVMINRPNSAKFSVSDDKEQRVFTVTIKGLTGTDADYYWCAVKMKDGRDDGARFHLSVTDNPDLYVDDQSITAFAGDDIAIKCFSRYSGNNRWCRLGGACVTSSSGWIGTTRVTITAIAYDFFTVNLGQLSIESSGWYLCDKSAFQMPVHINVTERPFTDSTAPNERHSLALEKFLTALKLLIFVVSAILVTWFLVKRYKQAKAKSSSSVTMELDAAYNVQDNAVVITNKTKDCKSLMTRHKEPGRNVRF